jgi:hypothetical protein
VRDVHNPFNKNPVLSCWLVNMQNYTEIIPYWSDGLDDCQLRPCQLAGVASSCHPAALSTKKWQNEGWQKAYHCFCTFGCEVQQMERE